MANKTPCGSGMNRTPEEARRLSISEAKLRALVKAGIIPGVQLGPRCWLFNPTEVDEALTQHQINPSK